MKSGGMKILYFLLPAMLLVSCKIEKKEKPASAPPVAVTKEAPATPAFDVNNSNSLVGQKLLVVKPALDAASIRFRVIEEDGEPFVMTMDYLPDRLNFKIKAGVIIEVSKG